MRFRPSLSANKVMESSGSSQDCGWIAARSAVRAVPATDPNAAARSALATTSVLLRIESILKRFVSDRCVSPEIRGLSLEARAPGATTYFYIGRRLEQGNLSATRLPNAGKVHWSRAPVAQ